SLSRRASNSDLSPWPADVTELRGASHSNYIPLEPLVSYKTQRIFHDAYEGIQDYMGTRVSYDYNNAWLRAVLVVLPDYSIRIREIAQKEQQLSVSFDRREGTPDLRAHCLIESTGGRQEIFAPINGSEAVLPLKSPLDQLERFQCFVVAPEGTLD